MKPLFGVGVWCALLRLHILSAQEICKTPTKLDGRCIPIDDCKHLKPFAMKSAEQREYLKLLTCGYMDQTRLVCCPNNRCVTFSGQESTCKPLESCPIIRKKLETRPLSAVNIEYVQRSRCDNSNNYYCCDPVDLRQRKGNEVFERLAENCPLIPAYNKIFRGVVIDIHPWIGIIEYYADNGPRLCVGSLIHKRYVLTAAHCLVSSNYRSLGAKSVRFGDFNITSEGPDCTDVEGGGIDCTYGEFSIKIESFVVHPEYNISKTLLNVNDIGLIRLKEPVPFNDFILPICLPRTDFTSETAADISLSVAGWGYTNETDYEGIKLENYMDFIDRETCVKRLRGYQPAIGVSQICAGGVDDEHVSDSGGPLILYDSTFCGIVGVFSFRPDQCAVDDCPGVYTKVYDYLDWIESNIKLYYYF